jgi:predicted DNA-binding protein
MSKPLSKAKATTMSATSPVHLRMPATLRQRLRRFAKERNLGESAALRLLISEHLDQVESERELAEAERWQFKQVWATWDRYRRGDLGTVSREEIDQVFRDALEGRQSEPRRK